MVGRKVKPTIAEKTKKKTENLGFKGVHNSRLRRTAPMGLGNKSNFDKITESRYMTLGVSRRPSAQRGGERSTASSGPRN